MAATQENGPMPRWLSVCFSKHWVGGAKGMVESLPLNSINEWYQLREAFTTRYSIRRACYKEPHEITKVVRRANETLPVFKERWTVETGLIMGVPEVMKISSFMDSIKSPKLANASQATYLKKLLNEMMRGWYELSSGERRPATKLHTGESRDNSSSASMSFSFPIGPRDVHQRLTFPTSTRNDKDNQSSQRRDYTRNNYKNPYKIRDNFNGGRHMDYRLLSPKRTKQQASLVPCTSFDSMELSVLKKFKGYRTKYPTAIACTRTSRQIRLRTGVPCILL
ncbi:hypothetical protein Tco_1016467 [Tanacetum coccineum]|uniref:Retrotransposon gag domain-containing protein n=1 Tax=Tanacetum coccineum TaxID=301880 RepID=A0ABQ5FR87_9ASTR